MWDWLKGKRERPPAPDCAGQVAADRAVKHEGRKLEAVREETRTIHAEAGELKSLGERNDFAARLRNAMGGTG